MTFCSSVIAIMMDGCEARIVIATKSRIQAKRTLYQSRISMSNSSRPFNLTGGSHRIRVNVLDYETGMPRSASRSGLELSPAILDNCTVWGFFCGKTGGRQQPVSFGEVSELAEGARLEIV